MMQGLVRAAALLLLWTAGAMAAAAAAAAKAAGPSPGLAAAGPGSRADSEDEQNLFYPGLAPAPVSDEPTYSFDAEWEAGDVWKRNGRLQLHRQLLRLGQMDALARHRHRGASGPVGSGIARNVILFVGDGMGVATSTAAGIMRGGEGHLLQWERFPIVGLAKTYSADHQVPDSASTATAMMTGAKIRSKMLGLDARANLSYCDASVNAAAALSSAARWAQASGRWSGVVTTARLTHATPAASYARINHRDWECDTKVPPEARSCVADIARQLVEELPGRDMRVVLGGGRRQFGVSDASDFDEDNSCVRADGRDLAAEWRRLGGRRVVVTSAQELLDPELPHRADYLLGLFAGGHMAYEAERQGGGPRGQPHLKDMVRVAIRSLRRNPRGFFLLVEGARIDMAHHKNMARLALKDALALDEAVATALEEVDLSDTLVVVTGDHSHAMTINGYPERGSDILGVAYQMGSRYNDSTVKYETLTYSTGPGARFHAGKRIQEIPEEVRGELRYMHQAGVDTGEDETHAGEDVPVYSAGPGSHLLQGVFEQSYIATAIAFAARMGEFRSREVMEEVLGDITSAAPLSSSASSSSAASALTATAAALLWR